MWCLVHSARPSLHSNISYGLLRTHVRLILIFQAEGTLSSVITTEILLKMDQIKAEKTWEDM
jgi:hypothetical protein